MPCKYLQQVLAGHLEAGFILLVLMRIKPKNGAGIDGFNLGCFRQKLGVFQTKTLGVVETKALGVVETKLGVVETTNLG